MYKLKAITEEFTAQSKLILGSTLTGVYLHGSAAMGCFNPQKSDIDLLTVIDGDFPDEKKLLYMDMVVRLNSLAPPKGIEMSVVQRSVCNPFVYPTPYELHFSVAHLEKYKQDAQGYIRKMVGTDRDLAAHFTITRHKGVCLFGKEISEVFGDVKPSEYFDSILFDIEDAESDIIKNPVYIILNLCRVLAYKKEGLVLSKAEGGNWALERIATQHRALVQAALDDDVLDKSAVFAAHQTTEFAKYMLMTINAEKEPVC